MKTQSTEGRTYRRFPSPRATGRGIVFLAAVILLGVITACKYTPRTTAPSEGRRQLTEALLRAGEKQRQINSAKADFIDYVQHMDTEYMFEDYYGIDTALAHDFQMPVIEEHAHQELLSYDTLDADTVYALIVRNNEQFKPYYKGWEFGKAQETAYDIDEPLLYKYAAIVCEVVNDALASDPRINRESLLCRVANLKILFSDTTNYNGKLTKDGAIILYPESIDEHLENDFIGRDMYEYYFRHELEHLFHMFCDDEREAGLTKGGVGIKFSSDRQNPLFWNWYYEGSAEKTTMNSMHSEPSTYFINIAYIDSLTFSFLPDPNVSCTTLERLHRPREQQLFFDLFANLEQDEVIKMMYALDLAILTPYEATILIDRATADTDADAGMSTSTLRLHLKPDALESMSKNLYLNLLYRIDGRDVALDDILHIIRLWEYDVYSHIAYTSEEKVEYNEDFIKRYSDMQTEFFRYLGARFHLTLFELDVLLSNYSARFPHRIPWLDEEKNQFLVYLAEKNAEYMQQNDGSPRITIRACNSILEKRRAKAAA